MLKFRRTKKKDIPSVEKMNGGEFLFKPGELSIIDGIVSEDDTDLAFGIVKPFAEAIFVADKSKSKIKRAKALNILMNVATVGTHRAGIKQLHVFVADAKLAESLEKHHGFIRCPEIVLVKNLT
jgi:hypothetical protein